MSLKSAVFSSQTTLALDQVKSDITVVLRFPVGQPILLHRLHVYATFSKTGSTAQLFDSLDLYLTVQAVDGSTYTPTIAIQGDGGTEVFASGASGTRSFRASASGSNPYFFVPMGLYLDNQSDDGFQIRLIGKYPAAVATDAVLISGVVEFEFM